MSDSISTLAELKAASQTPTAARNRLTYLFDEGKFTELDLMLLRVTPLLELLLLLAMLRVILYMLFLRT